MIHCKILKKCNQNSDENQAENMIRTQTTVTRIPQTKVKKNIKEMNHTK